MLSKDCASCLVCLLSAWLYVQSSSKNRRQQSAYRESFPVIYWYTGQDYDSSIFFIFLNLFVLFCFFLSQFYPLHPDVSMHILITVIYTFPKVLTRRICLAIKSFFSWWSFHLFLWPQFLIQGWYCKEKLDVSHS